MAAAFSAMSITLTGLTDTEINTLKGMVDVDVQATYQIIGSSGNLADLNPANFSGSVTLRPTDVTQAEHRGQVLDMVAAVITNPFLGWQETP